VFDRDAKFGGDVFGFLKASSLKPVRTSVRSPWQNGVAERWVGSWRRKRRHTVRLNHARPSAVGLGRYLESAVFTIDMLVASGLTGVEPCVG
jgi:transposase InsO family protein